jgi:hypothetical protein
MKIKDIVVREDGTGTLTTKPLPGAQQIIAPDGKAIGTADQATADAMKAAAEKGTLTLGGDEQQTSEEQDEHHDLVSQGNNDVGGDGTDQFIHDITMHNSTVDEDAQALTPQQQQALAPYLKKDTDGSQYYDYPDTDPKEQGAIMGTKITSPEALAQIKSPQGQADVIKHLLASTDPANAVPAVNSTSTPMSDNDAAKAMSDAEAGQQQATEAKRSDDELLEKMRMIAGLR